MLERTDMILTNTWWRGASGLTWTNGSCSTRLGYIAVPASFHPHIVHMSARYQTVCLLQLAQTNYWYDHAPLAMDISYRDWHDDTQRHHQCWQ
eukprot:16437848-Heterocapsa_arctica.AAC.1